MSDGGAATPATSAVRAVVAGHGGFAAALVDVVARVAGRGDTLVAVSNDGLDAKGIEAALRAAIETHGATVVFTDLPGGSVTMAARRVAQADPRVTVVTGANAAMLLTYVFAEPGEAGLTGAIEAARGAITVVPARGASRAD